MSFHIDTRNFPRFYDYDTAIRWFNRQEKPSSRSSKWEGNERPLDNVRMHYKRARMYDDRIELIYHKTPVVTLYKDGRVKFDVSYTSISTRLFAAAVYPVRVCYVDNRHWVSLDGTRWYPAVNSGIDLVFNKEKELVDAPHRVVREVLDKKKAAAVRKELAGFKKYFDAANAMGLSPTHFISKGSAMGYIRNWYDKSDRGLHTYATLYEQLGSVEWDTFRTIVYRARGCYKEEVLPIGELPRSRDKIVQYIHFV